MSETIQPNHDSFHRALQGRSPESIAQTQAEFDRFAAHNRDLRNQVETVGALMDGLRGAVEMVEVYGSEAEDLNDLIDAEMQMCRVASRLRAACSDLGIDPADWGVR